MYIYITITEEWYKKVKNGYYHDNWNITLTIHNLFTKQEAMTQKNGCEWVK